MELLENICADPLIHEEDLHDILVAAPAVKAKKKKKKKKGLEGQDAFDYVAPDKS